MPNKVIVIVIAVGVWVNLLGLFLVYDNLYRLRHEINNDYTNHDILNKINNTIDQGLDSIFKKVDLIDSRVENIEAKVQ
jgi:hypothetical protein